MKNSYKYLIWGLLFSFVVFSGSTTNNSNLIKVSKKNFPKIVKIKGEEILTNDYNHHHHIFIINDYLLTLVNSGDFQYHVFDKKSQKYLGPVGIRGEGPNEWEIPQTTLGQFENTKDGVMIWNFDFLRGNFNKINLTKTIASKSAKPIIQNTTRINMREFPFFQLFQGKNGRIYASSWIYEVNRVRLKSFNPTDKTIKRSELFPKIKNTNHLPSEVLNSLYGGSFDKHPSQDKFVQAMFMFNRIDIFDENLNVTKSIVDGLNWQDGFYDGKEIDPTKNFLRPRIDGFDGLAVGENFIFAVEADKFIENQKAYENKSFIRVYNWEGKPLAYLEVDNSLSSIDVDEANGFIYATDYENELVLRFNISHLIKEWKK